MKIRKSSGLSTDPCGTPDFTNAGPDVSPSTTTLGSSFKKQLYPSVHVAINVIAFQFPGELLVGNGVKSFGKFQDKHCCMSICPLLLLSTHSSLLVRGSPFLLLYGALPPASPASHLTGLLRRRDPSTNPGPTTWCVSVATEEMLCSMFVNATEW